MSTETIFYIIAGVFVALSAISSACCVLTYIVRKNTERDVQNAIGEIKRRQLEVKVDDEE